jgi:hypothetical protein
MVIAAAAVALGAGALYLYIDLYFTDNFLAFPLDDSYIFLQYARNAAAGHLFEYNVGDPTTTGATSYLYLLILTPLAVIFREPNSLVWATYVLNVVVYGVSVFLFAKIAGRLFEGRYVIPATAIFATTGVVTYHALAGMDGGIYIFALLFAVYTYLLYSEYGRVWPLAAGLAVLSFSRPEGIGAAAIIVACALLGRVPVVNGKPQPRRAAKWWVLLGLAPVPLYFLVNYLAGGHLTSTTFLSKSIWGPGTKPWPMRIAEILTYSFYAIKSIFTGTEGQYPKNLYNANIPHAAAAYFAPLTLAFFLVGWGRAARKSWSNRRPSPAFVAGIVFLAGIAAACIFVPFPRHFSRYLVPYYPLLLFGVLGGIDGLAVLIRYGRPAINHAAMFWTGAAYFLVFGLMSSAYFWVAYGMSARDIRFQHIYAAAYIRDHVPAGADVFTHDVGALAYYGGHRILDVEGLVTRAAVPYAGGGAGNLGEFVKHRGKPGDYFAGYLNIFQLKEGFLLEPPEFEVKLYTITTAGAEDLTLARFVPEVFEESPAPRFAGLANFEFADAVDVGYPLSEAAHDYRFTRRGAHNFSSFAAVLPLAGAGRRVFEAGRAINGVEKFDVSVPAGRDCLAVVRCVPPYRAAVKVNGAPVGDWETPAETTLGFVDSYFPIPSRFVRDGKLRLELETATGDYSYNQPARYYFYARR